VKFAFFPFYDDAGTDVDTADLLSFDNNISGPGTDGATAVEDDIVSV
jgi:hypothetical protein